ncbi:MAG: hypothetical protein FWG45_04325 [Oscillospiraceae bacterium]|nr:hypothetical protein [Oscillospiraceae bacterium]
MIDRIWEFLTSDDVMDRWTLRAILAVFLVAVFLFARYFSPYVLLGVLVLILGFAFVKITNDRANKRAEEEWQEIMHSEDDGVTGYIDVKISDELLGIKPKPAPKSDTNVHTEGGT